MLKVVFFVDLTVAPKGIGQDNVKLIFAKLGVVGISLKFKLSVLMMLVCRRG